MHRNKLFFLIALAVVLTAFVVLNKNTLVAASDAMAPAISKNQTVVVEYFDNIPDDLNRYEVVLFNPGNDSDDTLYVSRVIAFPGETLSIDKNMNIFVSGSKLNLPFEYNKNHFKKYFNPVMTPIDSGFFLLNDNLQFPQDSRHFGRISGDEIKGKVISIKE